MEKKDLYEKLGSKDRNYKEIVSMVINEPGAVPFLFEGLGEKNVRVRFGSLNTLVFMSESHPETVYPFFHHFVTYLDSENRIFALGAIKILANLTVADMENKFEHIFDRYYANILDPSMTPGANVSKGSAVIVKAKPHLADKVLKQLLKVDKTIYKTDECKNILIGHVLNTFDKIYDKVKDKWAILTFAKKNINNEWSATKKKAEKLLSKHINRIDG